MILANLLSANPPPEPEKMLKLGELLMRQERYRGAELFFGYVVGRQPENEIAWTKLADSLKAQLRFAEAIGCYQQALKLKPDEAMMHLYLGKALADNHQYAEAVAAYRQAIELDPYLVNAYSNLALERIRQTQLEEAEQTIRRALAIDPDAPSALYSQAALLDLRGCLETAQKYVEQALALQPNADDIRFSLGLLRLKRGDFAAGFRLYESRLRFGDQRRKFNQPEWDGSPLNGRRILVYGEQGTGDVIQFLRYLPLIQKRGGYVLLEHFGIQKNLIQGAAGYDELVEKRPHPLLPVVPFDVQVSIMSLAKIFETRVDSIPADIPYLTVEKARSEAWRERLAADGPGLKIGIAWTGSPRHFGNLYRSCTPETFAPLAKIPGIRLYSLQVGEAAQQTAELLADMSVIDLAPHLQDFADTAAAIQNLDLVITIDSSPAHIAGALGRPVWTLLASNNDWRWLLERRDTPWYPTMRLFRQSRLGDWASVMEEICEELRQWGRP